MIDESEMGNKSVRLGDSVTFNCKVREELSYQLVYQRNILNLHIGSYSDKTRL